MIGADDPQVGGVDYQPLVAQAHYLDEMQNAMNTSVHPGGTWNWRSQIVGLIDSWHNGYPSQATNSLYGLFALDRKSTRLNSSHSQISYAVFCLKKKTHTTH